MNIDEVRNKQLLSYQQEYEKNELNPLPDWVDFDDLAGKFIQDIEKNFQMKFLKYLKLSGDDIDLVKEDIQDFLYKVKGKRYLDGDAYHIIINEILGRIK